MKTYILRCERFDSCASLEDRLKWVKAGRVLLVMPEKDPPALSHQDLARLKRRAAGLHSQLGLVTSDAGLQEMARSVGLAAFSSSEDARQGDWTVDQRVPVIRRRPEVIASRRKAQREVSRQLPGWLRWLVFGLAVLAILTLIATLVPGAQVELNLPREEQTGDFVVPAVVNQPIPDLIAGIPLYKLSMDISATTSIKTTGTVSIGDKSATGMVLFTNLTDQLLVIPAGAIVRSLEPSFRYSVMKSGNLPAGPGTTISLQVVEMDGNGPAGNLPAGAIMAMDSPLGLSVSVSNPEALSGGTMKSSPALAQADIQAADHMINLELNKNFSEQVSTKLPEGTVPIEQSFAVEERLSESTPPPYDRPLSLYVLSRTERRSVLYFFRSDLEQWAALALDTYLDEDQITLSDSLTVETLFLDYTGDDHAPLSIHASRQIIPAFDPEAIAIQLRGLKPEDAANLIRTLIPGSQPVITLSPAWWRWLPFIPERISIHG